MRRLRPQTSQVSYKRPLNKSYHNRISDQENYDNSVCGQCCKPKSKLTRNLSRDDLSQTMNGFIPENS